MYYINIYLLKEIILLLRVMIKNYLNTEIMIIKLLKI